MNSAKSLGVTRTHDLRWNSHIDNITSKANRTLAFPSRNLRISSNSPNTSAYNTLVRPTLEYACTAWDPYTQRNIDKLEMVQRRAARFALNRHNNTSSVSGMLIQLGWYPLQIRRQALRLCMMYKLHNGLADLGTQQRMRPQSPIFSYKLPSNVIRAKNCS